MPNKKIIFISIVALVGLVVPGVAFLSTRGTTENPAPQSISKPLGVSSFAASCDGDTFLGLKTWHDGLEKDAANSCAVKFTNPATFVWTIALNILFDLLIVAGAWAVIMIFWNGYRYITAGGSAEKVQKAKSGLIQVMIGLLVAVLAATIVNFVTGRITANL